MATPSSLFRRSLSTVSVFGGFAAYFTLLESEWLEARLVDKQNAGYERLAKRWEMNKMDTQALVKPNIYENLGYERKCSTMYGTLEVEMPEEKKRTFYDGVLIRDRPYAE
ncbi:hypothetical protein NDN08_008218 [Rhodosorus marinus]|uniref:NADH dehydrogenase [ubiquinone] 1 alpha subcomplex subunit 13 n=1 Tax=Rhodosorus marinus TaxID=101924 RepID=A0AAV8V3L8_9RHOD|nr:hypothetical protein NDN08_008218 [Rhodosorus marinus]